MVRALRKAYGSVAAVPVIRPVLDRARNGLRPGSTVRAHPLHQECARAFGALLRFRCSAGRFHGVHAVSPFLSARRCHRVPEDARSLHAELRHPDSPRPSVDP
jgi:hypothetical protein